MCLQFSACAIQQSLLQYRATIAMKVHLMPIRVVAVPLGCKLGDQPIVNEAIVPNKQFWHAFLCLLCNRLPQYFAGVATTVSL